MILCLLPLILGFTAKGFDSSIVEKNITVANSDTNTKKTSNNSSYDPQNMSQYYIEKGAVTNGRKLKGIKILELSIIIPKQ